MRKKETTSRRYPPPSLDEPLLGSQENLDRVPRVLDLHYAASGSKINWSKTYLIRASTNDRTWTWGNALGAKWIATGESCRYLGIPFGFRVPQTVRNEKVLTTIRDALIYWSNRKLSQASRLLVSNQVILTSLWYLASTTDLGRKTFKITQGLVRDYLWSGKKEGRMRARIAWDAAVAPLSHGGIQIIDPVAQTQALLTKFLIRGLQNGTGIWRVFLQHRLDTLQPTGNRHWKPGRHWLMTLKNIRRGGSTLWGAVWQAWCVTRAGIT